MIIEPRIRGFMCLTAHPVGCEAHVREQVDYVRSHGPIPGGPQTALIVGASTGYGLASRIGAAFGAGAATVGVFFEKEPSERKTATAGWYNAVAFENLAREAGLEAHSINGDAFSDEIKDQTIRTIQDRFGPIDLLVYSVAAPMRTHPRTGERSRSVLKPIGAPYEGKTLDTDKEIIKPVSIEPASDEEISATVSVMGGEDWEMWVAALADADLIAPGMTTVAYTYIGTKLTWPIYWDGTIGKAKEDLDRAAGALSARLADRGGRAFVSVMKALVTQASSAIPVVPLYISVLYKVMKERGVHEGCVEQVDRMLRDRLYAGSEPPTDPDGRLRLDDLEMRSDVQDAVEQIWSRIDTESLHELSDFEGYRADFLKLFGFGFPDVDYTADVDHTIGLPE